MLNLPCQSCPFRIINHAKRVPKGLYTEANARRLWTSLSKGKRLACFEIDGVAHDVRECGGSLILIARHLQALDKYTLEAYLDLAPSSLSEEGVRLWRSRVLGAAPAAQALEELEPSSYGVPWSCPVSNNKP